ncbi:tripeptidyl-peptidase I [Malassezia psittaci]|uniref:tripeptidyl-peptidase II n=1 Tax=Malassezia psittaci TaxID=1821823 RepID=A0AAF0F8N1_9BASI|nr:tripeptidyl-peptidase I [Malassezia psittaci]
MRRYIAAVILLLALCEIAVAWTDSNWHIRRHHGWTKRVLSDRNSSVRVWLGTALNQTRIQQEIEAISDPCSSRYGEYLDADQTQELLSGADSSTNGVEQWLAKRQIEWKKPVAGMYAVEMPVSDASRHFNTTYHEYEHEDGHRVLFARAHQVPDELLGQATVFGPRLHRADRREKIVSDMSAHQRRSDTQDDALHDLCAAPVQPDCLRRIYGTATYQVQQPDANRVGVAGFLNQVPDWDDVQAYAQKYRPDATNISYTVEFSSAQSNQTFQQAKKHAENEAGLDVEMVVTQAYPIPVTFYSTAGHADHLNDTDDRFASDNEPFLDLFQYLLALPEDQLPSVLSISYSDPEESVPEAYAQRVCMYAGLLGIRGVTLLVGSGDTGVSWQDASECSGGKYQPWFPSTCPYFTSVGGTASPPDEVVANYSNAKYTSGSGFSNYFAQPTWQKSVVDAYVRNSVRSDYYAYFNASGRAYPDVAAQSAMVAVQLHNKIKPMSGTSAAAPIFASVIALLNDVRVSANQPRLGFFNPLLYSSLSSVSDAFYDIQQGSSSGCGTEGFPAAQGWDLASGFGTPNFTSLQQAVLNSSAACKSKPTSSSVSDIWPLSNSQSGASAAAEAEADINREAEDADADADNL